MPTDRQEFGDRDLHVGLFDQQPHVEQSQEEFLQLPWHVIHAAVKQRLLRFQDRLRLSATSGRPRRPVDLRPIRPTLPRNIRATPATSAATLTPAAMAMMIGNMLTDPFCCC